MELRETIKEILKSGLNQEELAKRLGVTQGKISEIAQGKSTWEKHWKVFVKLLPVCVELELIEVPARKLSTSLAGGLINAAVDKVTSGAQPRRKAGSRR